MTRSTPSIEATIRAWHDVKPLTDSERATLAMHWPVERPADQELDADVRRLVDVGALYVEDTGHGWRRIGLTDFGRKLLAIRDDPFRRCRRV